jgi:hypothetical protein
MNAELDVYKYEGNTAYGPSYADTAVTVDAYIESSKKTVIDTEGEEVIANYLCVIRDNAEIPAKSKIVYNGTEYEAINTTKYRPLNKFSHWEVYIR